MELYFHTVLGLLKKAALSHEELKNARSEMSDCKVSLENDVMLQSEIAAITGQFAIIFSAASCATRRSESVCAVLRQKALNMNLIKEREVEMK